MYVLCTRSLTPLLSLLVQVPVDVSKGVTDEQARQMAENLEFKGEALEKVTPSLHHVICLIIQSPPSVCLFLVFVGFLMNVTVEPGRYIEA